MDRETTDARRTPRTFRFADPVGFHAPGEVHELTMHRGNMATVIAMTDSELAALVVAAVARLAGVAAED